MSATTLSPRALEICAKHWGPERTRCQGCPLRAPCSNPVWPLTREGISAHADAVNRAAGAAS